MTSRESLGDNTSVSLLISYTIHVDDRPQQENAGLAVHGQRVENLGVTGAHLLLLLLQLGGLLRGVQHTGQVQICRCGRVDHRHALVPTRLAAMLHINFTMP